MVRKEYLLTYIVDNDLLAYRITTEALKEKVELLLVTIELEREKYPNVLFPIVTEKYTSLRIDPIKSGKLNFIPPICKAFRYTWRGITLATVIQNVARSKYFYTALRSDYSLWTRG